MKRRALARGASTVEVTILAGLLALGVAAAIVGAGQRLAADYVVSKKILASPMP